MCIMVNQKLQHDLGTQRTPSIVNPPGKSHDLSFHLPNCNCQARYQAPHRRNNLAERPFQPGGLNRRFVNGVSERETDEQFCAIALFLLLPFISRGVWWRFYCHCYFRCVMCANHHLHHHHHLLAVEKRTLQDRSTKKKGEKKNTWPAIPWALAKSKTKQNRNTIITLLCTIVRNREDELCGQVTRMLYWWVFPFTFFFY